MVRWFHLGLALSVGLGASACGRRPCAEPGADGPVVRLDVALEQCNLPPAVLIDGPFRVQKRSLVVLEGGASVDPNGDELRYRWRILEEPSDDELQLAGHDSPRVTFTPVVSGPYALTLTVDDGDISASAEHDIFVYNTPPVAVVGEDVIAALGTPATLDGTGSSDPDGDPLAYTWRIVERPAGSTAQIQGASSASPTFVPDIYGVYHVELVVNDGEEDSPPVRMRVGGGITGVPPVAVAATGAANGVLGLPMQLDGTMSADPDGRPIT